MDWAREMVPEPVSEKTRSLKEDRVSHLLSWKADLALCSAEEDRLADDLNISERSCSSWAGAFVTGKEALHRREMLNAFKCGTACEDDCRVS